MDQFRDIIEEESDDMYDEGDIDEPINPVKAEAEVKARLDNLEEEILRHLKYFKKSGHKPTLRHLKFQHWKPVLKILMEVEVLREIINHPGYKNVRPIAEAMLQQLNQVKINKAYIKRAQNLINQPVPGFYDKDFSTVMAKFEGELGIQDRIQATLKRRKKAEILRSKLYNLGVTISDKLERVLQMRENFIELKKNVLNQAKERFKILIDKKHYIDALMNRKKIRDYFLIGWKRELEKEWSEMGKQASKLNASKHVRKRLKEMKYKKKIMTVQLASLPPNVRRHLITTEVTKIFRDIKRSVEEIRNKKPSFETIMLRKVEKRKERKLLKVAKKKLLMKEEENRLRALKARNKKKLMTQTQAKIKQLKTGLKQSNDIIKNVKSIIKPFSSEYSPSVASKFVPQIGKPVTPKKKGKDGPYLSSLDLVSATSKKTTTSNKEEHPVRLKDEYSHRPDPNFRIIISGDSTDTPFDTSDKKDNWRSKISSHAKRSSDELLKKMKKGQFKRKSYFEKLQQKIEKNQIIAKYTQRLHDSILGLQNAFKDKSLPIEYRSSLTEQINLLEEVLARRSEISEKLEKETKNFEEIHELIKIAKKARRMKRKQEKEMLRIMEKDIVFDFPDNRQPLWSITGDGWSWTGYKVYPLDDPIHPWGFTQGLRERTPLQLGTIKFPPSYSISGYSNFKDFSEQLKADYIDLVVRTTRTGTLAAPMMPKSITSISADKKDETGLQAFFKKLAEGIEVPHLPNRIAKPYPLPSFNEEVIIERESGPEAFPLRPDLPETVQTYGFKYVIRLTETETLDIFDKESNIIYPDTQEAQDLKVLENYLIDNKRKRETYEMNVSDACTQVVEKPMGHFASQKEAPERVSVGTQACLGEIMQGVQVAEVQQEIHPHLAYLAALASSTSEDEDDASPRSIVCSKAFFETANTIERILSTNPHVEDLISYQGALVPDPYAPYVEINSELIYLWTFRYPRKVNERRIKRQSVTSIAWSDKLEEVIAVGYGSFYSTTYHYGLICIWNLKNLTNPERIMMYKAGVCHVEFSSKHPYILSTSFQDGFVAVYNIYPTTPSILCDNKKSTVHHGEPVWQVSWMNNSMGEEVLVAGGQTGEFYSYAKQSFSRPNILMAINKKEGKVVGFEESKGSNPKLNTVPGITCFVPVPADKENFLVGTDDGSVRVISLFARNLQTDLFNAHRGKINRIEFNPFCSKLFFTVGGDFALRVWVYGLKSPILTLVARDMYIEDAAWSPANPSLLVSIGGIYIDLWDLGRCGIGKPIATSTNPKNKRNASVRFSNNGRNIGVGDLWGDLHIFCLNKMPFDPLLPQEALLKSISNALAFTPEVLNQVIKAGPPFDRITNVVRKKEDNIHIGKKEK